MIERIVIALITHFGAKLLTWVIQKTAKNQLDAVAEVEVDQKLVKLKAAYTEALDGSPVTKEQREELNKAITDFIGNFGSL